MSKFSPQLQERIIQYFRKRNNVELSTEQAEQYLNAWADLFGCLATGESGGSGMPAGQPDPRSYT